MSSDVGIQLHDPPSEQATFCLLRTQVCGAMIAEGRRFVAHQRGTVMSEELTWLPAWQIRELIAKGEVSPVEVLDHFLGRIEQHDVVLKAFKYIDREGARGEATRAERAVVNGDHLGPLHGIPISVKEHIAVEGMPTTGPMAGPGIARWDDLSVERLRQAGAIIIGTNTMMGTGAGSMMSFDWEHEARNPWDSKRVPGWSSSGGAASAVARLLPITIGSDGGGSTRLPAAYSGVVGVHPSQGRVPYVNYASPMLRTAVTYGPLSRDVRDAAITLQAMAGPDGRDLISMGDVPEDYQANIDSGVDGLRFAWTDDFGYASLYALEESSRVIAAVRAAAQGLTSLGASVETTTQAWEDFFLPMGVTGRAFSVLPSPLPKPTPEEYQAAAEARGRNVARFYDVLADYDLLLSPTSQLVARTVEEWDACWTTNTQTFPHGTFAPTYTSHTHMFNWIGWPAVSVPCGFVDGLPIGLQLIGKPGSEALIFRVAQAFQKAFPRDERPLIS
jgi:Asp-tRNA(Asn)/Glu-tRNA(Gln) amidotransferase A subunit family amidase